MPDRSGCPNYDICKVCVSLKDAPCGLFPCSHAEVCCRFKIPRGATSATEEDGSSCSNQRAEAQDRDGLCKDCPLRVTSGQEALHVAVEQVGEAPNRQPRTQGRQRSPQKGVRKRQGYKKTTLELRPPRFKAKLWFGTYMTQEEINRAKDATKFYMPGTSEEEYNFPDSPLIFSKIPLQDIKYQDLDLTCQLKVIRGGKTELAHKYFAKEVKRVVKLVLKENDEPARQQQRFCGSSLQNDHTRAHASQQESIQSQPEVMLMDPISTGPINSSTSGSTSSPFTDMIEYNSIEPIDLSGAGLIDSSPVTHTIGDITSDLSDEISKPEQSDQSPSPLTEVPISYEEISIYRHFGWPVDEMFAPSFGLTLCNSDGGMPCDLSDGTIGPEDIHFLSPEELSELKEMLQWD